MASALKRVGDNTLHPMKPAPVNRSNPLVWTDHPWLGSARLFALVLLAAYWPALHGGRLWDDDAHITEGSLQSLAGLGRIWFRLGATQQYYPVLHSAFWIEHRLWGDAVFGYHLLNVALHGCAAWLLVRVLRQLAFPAASLVGLAFALHPVAVESVAWISEQKNTLSAVFYLGAAWCYLRSEGDRHHPRFGDPGAGPRKAVYYWAASGLFLLALLTKSVTATLPAALLVVRWWQTGRLDLRRDVAPLLPWFAVAALSGAFTAWVERTYIGASGADFNLSGAQRLALAGRTIVFYAAKAVWPRHLMFIYPRWSIGARSPAAWFSLGAVAIVLAALALIARRRRGPLAAALFFGGTLFPALGFVNVYPFVFSFVADHFQYLASIGILAPLGWALGALASCPRWSATSGRAGPSSGLDAIRAGALGLPSEALEKEGGRAAPQMPWSRVLPCLILLIWPAMLGVLTFRQAGFYRDADTLNRATLAANPDAWLAHYNLAVSLSQRPNGQAEAIAHYRETVRLKPDHWAAHCNLATALAQAGQPAEAIAEYQAALQLNPNFAEAHNDLAVLLGREPGGQGEAIRHLRTAVRLRPDYDGAHSNLGAQLMRSPAARREAAQEFQTAVRLAPDNPEYHYNLADAWSEDPAAREAAVGEYRTALRLRPDYLAAHANLAALLVHLPGRAQEAIAEYQAALRLAPANAPLHFQLAVALIVARRPRAEAAAELQTALRLQPDLRPARLLLDKLQ